MASGVASFYFLLSTNLGYSDGFPVYKHKPTLVETTDRTDSFWIEGLTMRLFDSESKKSMQVEELFKKAFETLGEQLPEDPLPLEDSDFFRSRVCLVEVAVEISDIRPIQMGLSQNPESQESSAFTALFNEALAGLRIVLRAHTAATGQIVEVPSVRSIGSMIPYALSSDLESLYAGQVSWGVYIVPQEDYLQKRMKVELSEEELASYLTAYLLVFENNGPFVPYSDLEQESIYLLKVAGQFRAGIITLASSIELLLDDLLLLFLWEQRMEPKESISKYFKDRTDAGLRPNSISKRVKSHLTEFLGKEWTEGAGGVVDSWNEHIADLRNLVAHNGLLPTEAEVTRALNVHDDLQKHVGDCLFQVRADYPLTAESFLGEAGLEARGEKFVPPYSAKRTGENQERFSRYRAEVKNGLLPQGKRKKASKMSADFVCLFRVNKDPEYFLVDPGAAKLARIKSIQNFPRKLRKEIQKLTSQALDNLPSGPNMTCSLPINVNEVPGVPSREPAWKTLPTFDIFPLVTQNKE